MGEAVRHDGLADGVADLLFGVRDLDLIQGGRAEQAVDVVAQPEDGGTYLGVVGADALEHTAAVVQPVREDVYVRVRPIDE